MHNPFKIPETLPQWLLSSLCWAASCWAAFYLFSWGNLWLWKSDGAMVLIFGAAAAVFAVMWKRVIKIGWRLWLGNGAGVAVNIVSTLWLLLLTGVFVMSILGSAFGGLIWLAFATDSGSGGGGWDY